MAEIVGSAVVQESVSKILSCLLQKYEEKQNSIAIRNLERLEMAHIRLWRLFFRHLISGLSLIHPCCVGVGSLSLLLKSAMTRCTDAGRES
jgi:hypothetical protein